MSWEDPGRKSRSSANQHNKTTPDARTWMKQREQEQQGRPMSLECVQAGCEAERVRTGRGYLVEGRSRVGLRCETGGERLVLWFPRLGNFSLVMDS